MKKVFYIAVAIYSFNFIIGYAAVHLKGKDSSLPGCKAILKYAFHHTLAVAAVMPGESNACMDFGLYPQENP